MAICRPQSARLRRSRHQKRHIASWLSEKVTKTLIAYIITRVVMSPRV